jgi:hypothetical protein
LSDLETRLERALEADAAPARDPMFRIEILQRRERTAYRRLALAATALAAGAALIAALIAGLVMASIGGRPIAALAAGLLLLLLFLAAPRLAALPAVQGLFGGWHAQARARLRTIPTPRLWY